ncbi:TPA_asm: P [Rhododendron delavayi virus 1]|uniref:P n=1 Tax=Rhododendron delavayi virus 1 TaxID=2793739 RepID=A0A8D9UJ21_9RHAB|nr:P [Rhododendron delavayi virus 1] [Rhododendron delavayi virus 1]DAF42304.1 TPA_asm: P [Rhododendron delavayi virus 1]
MENIKINPKFAGINKSAKNSEVLTSQYTDVIEKAGGEDKANELLPAMMEWNNLLTSKGIALPDSIIEGIAEVHLSIDNADARVKSLHVTTMIELCLHYQGMISSPMTLESKMDTFLDKMYVEMEKLKELSKKMEAGLPRTIIKPSKKSSSGKSHNEGKDKSKDTIKEKEKEETMVVDEKVEEIGSSNNEEMETDKGTNQDVQKGKADVVPDYTNIDKMSQEAEMLRDRCRKHYTSELFESWDDAKKRTSILYYTANILRIEPEGWNTNTDVYHMVHDLIDKTSMIYIFEMVKEGKVPIPVLHEAIDDFVSTVMMYHAAYGEVTAVKRETGGIPRVELI